MDESKEPFVGAADRANVQLNPDQPISELRVRDLHDLIVTPIVVKIVRDKAHYKWEKFEKIEKPEKFEKLEKFEKFEKIEKPEKPEKLEYEIAKPEPERVGPVNPLEDPRINQLIEQVAKLTERLEDVAQRVDKLGKRG